MPPSGSSCGRALPAEALALARARDAPRAIAAIRAVLGNLARYEGHLDEATAEYAGALETARRIGHRTYEAWAIAGLGQIAFWRGDLARADTLLVAAEALYRASGNAHSRAFVTHARGFVDWRAGDRARAELCLSEALARRRELGDRGGVADSLEGLALVAAAAARWERAARLLAAAGSFRAALGATSPPVERVVVVEATRAIRTALGEPGFAATWAAGAAKPIDLAVAEALSP